MLPRDARLTCPGEEVWTLPGDPGWREVTRSHPEVSVVREAGGGPPREHAHEPFFALAPCSTMSLKRS